MFYYYLIVHHLYFFLTFLWSYEIFVMDQQHQLVPESWGTTRWKNFLRHLTVLGVKTSMNLKVSIWFRDQDMLLQSELFMKEPDVNIFLWNFLWYLGHTELCFHLQLRLTSLQPLSTNAMAWVNHNSTKAKVLPATFLGHERWRKNYHFCKI